MIKKISGVVVLLLTIFIVSLMLKSKKRPSTSTEPQNTALKIVTAEVAPAKQKMVITANGNANAVWQTTLTSEVTGQIIQINDQLLVGARFKKGEPLIKIDATQYHAQLNRQLANLAAAQERLVDEQIRAQRAKTEWQSLNLNKKASDYTLRKPQLFAAEKNHQASQSDVKAAQTLLEKTTIIAPYDGYVTNRFVDIGEVVQMGSELAEIFSSQQLELTLPLKHRQVEMIMASQTATFTVHDIIDPSLQWEGRLKRVEQAINPDSRWRNIFLSIEPNDALDKKLPINGAFLQTRISIDLNQEYLIIDEKSMTMQGEIWTVDDNNLLQKSSPATAFSNAGNIYLHTDPNINYPINLVVFPSSTLLQGTQVIQQNLLQELVYE